jgi:hypothetical protein
VLRTEKRYCHRSKCHFGQPEVQFLGHTISAQGLSVDTTKTEAIANWPVPCNQKQLQSFSDSQAIISASYQYAVITLPFGPLLKKDHTWHWEKEHNLAFQMLKAVLQTTPVLQLRDFSKLFFVTTDASGYCVGGVLSQMHECHAHPLAFFSKKLGVHELNWPTPEKEIFATKLALEKWRHYLYGRHFDIYMDNSAFQWLLQYPKVSAKLARFLTFFAEFDFTLHHPKGSMNVVADALPRPPVNVVSNSLLSPDMAPPVTSTICFHTCTSECDTFGSRYRVVTDYRAINNALSNPTRFPVEFTGEETVDEEETDDIANGYLQVPVLDEEIAASVVQMQHSSSLGWSPELRSEFMKAYLKDPGYCDNIRSPKLPYVVKDGLLYVRSQDDRNAKELRLCVPQSQHNRLRTNIIQQFYDSSIAANPEIRRTYLRIKQWYYWASLHEDVSYFVQSCETCSRCNAKKMAR